MSRIEQCQFGQNHPDCSTSGWEFTLTILKENSTGVTGTVRTTRYEYTDASGLKKLISQNPDTEEQVTEWVRGVTTGQGSALNTNRLVFQKIYPGGGGTNTVTYTYNRQSQPLTFTDQAGTKHTYGYDRLGRLLADAVTFAPGSQLDSTVGLLTTGYNERGLIIRSTSLNADGTVVVNEVESAYNDFNQLISEWQEHCGPVTESSLKVQYAYENGAANTIRPTTITSPGATAITTAYESVTANALSRPDRVIQGLDILASMKFLGLGTLVELDYEAASHARFTLKGGISHDAGDIYTGLDRFGRLIETIWKTASTTLIQTTYGRNRVGGVVWQYNVKAHSFIDPVKTQDNRYWYDDLRQVTRHDRGDLVQNPSPELPSIDPATRQQQEVFTYDETGNWNSENIQNPALAQTRTHNPANQITGISGPGGAVQPAYDPAGNMTLMPRTSDWTAGDELTWDAWNRLTRIRPAASSSSSSSGSSSSSSSSSSSEGHSSSGSYHSASSSSGLPSGEVHYQYDARTRRTRKTNTAGTIDYYYDKQWRAIEERVSGSITAEYVWSPFDRWTMIRRKRGSEELYVLKDYLDPAAIIDTDAEVIERFGYDAFGTVRFMDEDFEPRTATAAAWNFLFHAEFLDEDTGLYNYGYRYYHLQLGRWLSRDPIGKEGGLNLYGFVGNEAIMRIDILGLVNNRPVPCCEEEKILGEGLKRSLQAVELTRNDSVPADASKNRPSPRREYCGLICCHKYLSWIASTEPIAGSRTFGPLDPQGGRIYNAHKCSPLQNGDCSQIYGEEWDTVSFYHSQPNQSIFSEADWAFVLHQGQFPLFLGTPDGEVLILGKLGNRRKELPNGGVIRKPAPIMYPVIPHPDFPNGGILGGGQSPLTFE